MCSAVAVAAVCISSRPYPLALMPKMISTDSQYLTRNLNCDRKRKDIPEIASFSYFVLYGLSLCHPYRQLKEELLI